MSGTWKTICFLNIICGFVGLASGSLLATLETILSGWLPGWVRLSSIFVPALLITTGLVALTCGIRGLVKKGLKLAFAGALAALFCFPVLGIPASVLAFGGKEVPDATVWKLFILFVPLSILSAIFVLGEIARLLYPFIVGGP